MQFPDYTNPEVREWWAGLFKELISDIGVKGVWNDMNEPAVMEVPKTFPMDVRHDYDGNPCSHRKAHNNGTQMARATYHGVKDLLTRKAFYYYKICLCRGATLQFLLDRR
jgi:alpha-glucosidase